MFPIKTFVSERRAANLLTQIRWRDGVYCPRCRGESVIRYGSYRVFQRYLCKDCDRTFNDQTGTVFEHSTVELRKWFLAVYTYIRFNASFRQLDVEIDVSCKTIYRRVQRFLRALDVPRLQVALFCRRVTAISDALTERFRQANRELDAVWRYGIAQTACLDVSRPCQTAR